MKKMILNILKGLVVLIIVSSLCYFGYSFIENQNDQIAEMQQTEMDRTAYEDSVLTVQNLIKDEKIKREIQSLEDEINSLTDELTNCNDKFDKSYSGRKIKLYKKDLKELTTNYEDLEDECSGLTTEFQLLKVNNAELNIKLIEYLNKNSQLENKNNELIDEVSNSSTLIANKDSKIKNINSDNENLLKDLEIYKTIVTKLRQNYSTAEEAYTKDEFNDLLESLKVQTTE